MFVLTTASDAMVPLSQLRYNKLVDWVSFLPVYSYSFCISLPLCKCRLSILIVVRENTWRDSPSTNPSSSCTFIDTKLPIYVFTSFIGVLFTPLILLSRLLCTCSHMVTGIWLLTPFYGIRGWYTSIGAKYVGKTDLRHVVL